jgi:hypothetical protein
MPRPAQWRVRVKRSVELWVDVLAHSAIEAEAEAAKVPQVLSVFAKSAIRADEAAPPERLAGVED